MKTRHGLILVLLFTIVRVVGQNPTLVWTDADGGERNEYVFFQKSIELESTPTEALLHLYADSRYALYVNGEYINFGPARSYHKNPLYDSYDLAPMLVVGSNCLVVKVLSNGMETFQLFDYYGAFAAWGNIGTAHRNINLDALTWRCRTSKGYDSTMPRFSFATGAIENWDARKDKGWNSCQSDVKAWKRPVRLESNHWGRFRPRPIPHLTREEIKARPVSSPMVLSDSEDLYSLRIPVPDANLKEYNRSVPVFGYTYLYSDQKQEVDLGLWWGDYFLNGTQIVADTEIPETNYRRTFKCSLKKGWNLLTVKYGIIWGSWEFYLAVPKNKGVVVNAQRSKSGSVWFKTYLPISEADMKTYEQLDPAHLSIRPEAVFTGRYVNHQKNKTADHPVRDMVWKRPDTTRAVKATVTSENSLLFTLPPQGVALQYELEEIQLGRFYVEGDFPSGTVIDIGFSEEPHPQLGGPWLYKRYQVAAGMRFVADGETKRYESFKPYGAKYLQLNLYNPNKKVSIQKVGMVRQVYPFKNFGDFQSSDSLLNKIHEAGWRTLQLCAEDSYTDTPFRERGLYAGDFFPETVMTMAMSGDMRLVHHSLELFQQMYHEEMYAGQQNRHNDFPLITLLVADNVHAYTEDLALVQDYYENYAALVRNHLKRRNHLGLVHADRVFIEWTDLNKTDAYMTAFQALLVKSLRIMASWAEKLKKPEEALTFTNQAARLSLAINRHLWDDEKGLYFDGYQNAHIIDDHHLTSSIWPALFEIADKARTHRILEHLETELTDIGDESRKRKITPYSSFYLFALLYGHGKTAMAEDFMKKHWSPMALHSARPTVWENFDIDGDQGTSSHAWSGHPVYFMATETLGVNLGFYQDPDSVSITIRPNSSYLNWARGTVMHPWGPVSVHWEIKQDELHVNYKVTKGKNVLVAPRGRLAELKLVVNRMED